MMCCTNSSCDREATRLVAVPAGSISPGKGSVDAYCEEHRDRVIETMGGFDVTEGTGHQILQAAFSNGAFVPQEVLAQAERDYARYGLYAKGLTSSHQINRLYKYRKTFGAAARGERVEWPS
jgi:hypothetical protein